MSMLTPQISIQQHHHPHIDDDSSTGGQEEMAPKLTIEVGELVKTLVRLSERAANVARSLRAKPQLLDLLVEQKDYAPKLRRDKPDFKTLADVLIQETIRFYLAKEYPIIASQLRGEENSQFTNTRGHFINVQVLDSIDQMTETLCGILDGNEKAARALAEVVHSEPDALEEAEEEADKIGFELPANKCGVWIDPIDSTSEYVYGKHKEEPRYGVYLTGLQCVTVLLGVFDLDTGTPIIGVINQPFCAQNPETKEWQGRCVWGVSIGDRNFSYGIRRINNNSVDVINNNVRLGSSATSSAAGGTAAAAEHSSNSLLVDGSSNDSGEDTLSSTTAAAVTGESQQQLQQPPPPHRPIIVMSTSETEQLKDALDETFTTLYAAGAGYKLLCVALGLADAYILSRPTTFKWDSCGPHAILKSIGGGVCDFAKALTEFDLNNVNNNRQNELQYMYPDNPNAEHPECWCNEGGLLAYANLVHMREIVNKLKDVIAEGLME